MTAFVGWKRIVSLRLSKCFSVMTVTSACVPTCNVTRIVFTSNVTVGFDGFFPVARYRQTFLVASLSSSGWLVLGSDSLSKALTCLPKRFGFLLGHALAK